jgi:hypothetical protein
LRRGPLRRGRPFPAPPLISGPRDEIEQLSVIERIVDFDENLGVIFYVAYVSMGALVINLNRDVGLDMVEKVLVREKLFPVFIHTNAVTCPKEAFTSQPYRKMLGIVNEPKLPAK